jgi:4-hydroxy-3-methylbut-2-enyl diphosphate reductase
MNLHLARHYGMCFGVRDALRATHAAAVREPVTVLGQLVHNPVVDRHLTAVGVRPGRLDAPATTRRVVITAHGVADVERVRWQAAGHVLTDTTCPLVRKAHEALALLVAEGCHPVVIGQPGHAEVRGLIGDHPGASVIDSVADLAALPNGTARFGVVAQTTQPLERVLALLDALKRGRPAAEVRFMDTVCRPTKQRQAALEELAAHCEAVVVVGGRNSNNTRQLADKARALGLRVIAIETADELRPEAFAGLREVGVTAGTSTLDETVAAVLARLKTFA